MSIEDGYKPEETETKSPGTSYERGMRVRIPRSDGEIESHWEVVGSVTPDGKIHVIDPYSDESKMISIDTLDKYNGPMHIGSIVKIRRSNGLVDDGWEIAEIEGEGPGAMVVITKDLLTPDGSKKHKKPVKMSSLLAVN